MQVPLQALDRYMGIVPCKIWTCIYLQNCPSSQVVRHATATRGSGVRILPRAYGFSIVVVRVVVVHEARVRFSDSI